MGEKPVSIESWLLELGNPSADRDYKPGHERLLALLSELDCRRPALRIRIAGTNGKGSTASMLAAALQSAGLKVGLFTSPHILEFNERIRINGVPVAYEKLMQSMQEIMPLALKVGASYFETATALALDQFSKAAVDVEILEAGVGARLDATTAVAADMALITPIALDHQAWLGDQIEAIALEKAHAMQGCRYNISAPQQQAVTDILMVFNPDMTCCETGQHWDSLAMPGAHQSVNASLAWSAVNLLAQHIPALDLDIARQAIIDCRVSGRLEKIQLGLADVWLDAAHNRHAVEALLPSLPALADPFDAIIVSTREDRSLTDSLELLQPYARRVICNGIDESAMNPADLLADEIRRNPEGSFLALGSFITVAAIFRSLNSQPTTQPD